MRETYAQRVDQKHSLSVQQQANQKDQFDVD